MARCVIEFCCTVRQLDAARATSKRQRRGQEPHRAVLRAEVFDTVGKPLPTSLRHGATLSHIRRYLGHVSDRMAEHYAKVAVSEIEDILQHVWVTGPGAANPGELLSSHVTPMNRLQAEALALDLSRRSTPAEGGFCTFQPVVDGGACPWKLYLRRLRQVRHLRCRPALLAAQTRAVELQRRTRSRRRRRQLPAPGLRAHRPRHRRAGAGPRRARPARRRPRPGPAPSPGLLPAPVEHRVPRRRPRPGRRRRTSRPR